MTDFLIEIDSEWTPVAKSGSAAERPTIPMGVGFYYRVLPSQDRPVTDYDRAPYHDGTEPFSIALPANSTLWLATRRSSAKTTISRPVGGADEVARQSAAEAKGPPYTAFASFAAALGAEKPADLNSVSAKVNGRLVEWVRDPAGTGLGGGWSPAGAVTPEHFGAVGDGVANDTAAVQAALAAGIVHTRKGAVYNTTLTRATLSGRIDGDGQVQISGGSKLGKTVNFITAPPASRGNAGTPGTAFGGDMSKSGEQIEYRVRGENTLGKPTSGFEFNWELAPRRLFMVNENSGWNNDPGGDGGGRTSWMGYAVQGHHLGLGGMLPFTSFVTATGNRPGATSFLANGSAGGANLNSFAGADHVYLNPLETNCEDMGRNAAAVGVVANLVRSSNAGGLGEFWSGCRLQANGTAAINAGYQVTGSGFWETGIDLTPAKFTENAAGFRAAVAIKQDDRIYFRASRGSNQWHKTVDGEAWISANADSLELRNPGVNGVAVRGDQSTRLFLGTSATAASLTAANVTASPANLNILTADATGTELSTLFLNGTTGNVNIVRAGAKLLIGGTEVVGAQQAAIANAATGTEITTINAILAALRTHGLIAT